MSQLSLVQRSRKSSHHRTCEQMAKIFGLGSCIVVTDPGVHKSGHGARREDDGRGLRLAGVE